MRSIPLLVFLAGSGLAFAQVLTCPQVTDVSGRPCEIYHYHVRMYRPDTRGFVELYGINQFASQPSCEHAREAQMARNLALVNTLKRVANEQQYQPDQFGPCHCDMTVDPSSPNFLSAAQRIAQLRFAEEVRERVREHLLDRGLTTDSDAVRGIEATPAPNAVLQGPRLMPLPPAQVAAVVANLPDDLKPVKVTEDLKTAPSSIDLPLVDPSAGEVIAAAPSSTNAVPAGQAAPDALAKAADANASLETAAPSTAPDATADEFITTETKRIQAVLTASSSIADEAVKSRILQACMQRIQLLSNLRTLIQASGARSRLATAARTAGDEQQRLTLLVKLFGNDMTAHWAPKDPAEVILPPMPEVDADPESVLRDTSSRYSDQQKRRALYILLAQSQPTEDQQLWLSTVVDTFLQ